MPIRIIEQICVRIAIKKYSSGIISKSIMTENKDELVSISLERYNELSKLQEDLPNMVQKAIAEYKKNTLKRLHERDKNDPESVKLRVQRYIAKNRDKINERRREKRKEQKKFLNSAVRTESSVLVDIITSSATENFAGIPQNRAPSVFPDGPLILQNDITVRFDD